MNKVVLMGRLTREPEVRYTAGDNPVAVGRYTLAVDRKTHREGEASADFINCTVFGRQAEFAGKYFRKGTRIIVSGRIQTGSYTNREGRRVYTTDVLIEEQEFAESKSAGVQQDAPENGFTRDTDGFMTLPEGIEEEIPFC